MQIPFLIKIIATDWFDVEIYLTNRIRLVDYNQLVYYNQPKFFTIYFLDYFLQSGESEIIVGDVSYLA